MAKVFTTPRCNSDLFEIWSYIKKDNIAAADRVIALLNQELQILAKSPEMGRIRNALALGLRSFPVEPYVIFYRAIKEGIAVVRVIHGSRDIDNIFGS